MSALARSTGDVWENAALAHLQSAGLALMQRNFLCRHGEIDLVMRDRGAHAGIVFVEVRYRKSGAHGDGTASVGATKRAKLVRAAQTWLQAHPRLTNEPCRFDVIGCSGTPQQPQFDWTRAAFDADI
jgi:putative endonuclease